MRTWGCLTHSLTSLQRQETSRNFLGLPLEQGFISDQHLKFRRLDTTGPPRPSLGPVQTRGEGGACARSPGKAASCVLHPVLALPSPPCNVTPSHRALLQPGAAQIPGRVTAEALEVTVGSEVILGRFARPRKGAFTWALLYLRPFLQLTFFFPNPIS